MFRSACTCLLRLVGFYDLFLPASICITSHRILHRLASLYYYSNHISYALLDHEFAEISVHVTPGLGLQLVWDQLMTTDGNAPHLRRHCFGGSQAKGTWNPPHPHRDFSRLI